MQILERRLDRFKSVISKRQFDLTLVLENVHDPHNIGAVLRTADSVGVHEIFVVYTDPILQKRGIEIGFKSSSGAKQWIDIHYYTDVSKCFNDVKLNYSKIFGTKLDSKSVDLYDMDLTCSCALTFGNEHQGLSPQACSYLDSNFIIPQHGFVKSLNISVACAVSLYEAQRQRRVKGSYDGCHDHKFPQTTQQESLYQKYKDIHIAKKMKVAPSETHDTL